MDGDVKKVQLSVIREQGEYMEPVPLTAEESATVTSRESSSEEE